MAPSIQVLSNRATKPGDAVAALFLLGWLCALDVQAQPSPQRQAPPASAKPLPAQVSTPTILVAGTVKDLPGTLNTLRISVTGTGIAWPANIAIPQIAVTGSAKELPGSLHTAGIAVTGLRESHHRP